MTQLRNEIIALAKKLGADIVGFAPIERFDQNDNVRKIFPQTKTVIGLAFRVLRGIYRGTEEGTTYYQYTTMGVENMEETIMPMASLRVAMLIEENGYTALPQRRHQQIMNELNSTNPEVAYDAVYRGVEGEKQMDFLSAAVKCGLGEKGKHGALLTDRFGPMARYCFVLTDAQLAATDEVTPHLCDNCGACIAACPGKAIDGNGKVNPWQCAVYYNGANGTKNPFMPPEALEGIEKRMDIIAGNLQLSVEEAKEVLDKLYFYPPAQHAYQCSICGRACDVACYAHLESKGLLTNKFTTPFHKRDWSFPLSDFEEKK